MLIKTIPIDELKWHRNTKKFVTTFKDHPFLSYKDEVEVKNPRTENSVKFQKESVKKNSIQKQKLLVHFKSKDVEHNNLNLFVIRK